MHFYLSSNGVRYLLRSSFSLTVICLSLAPQMASAASLANDSVAKTEIVKSEQSDIDIAVVTAIMRPNGAKIADIISPTKQSEPVAIDTAKKINLAADAQTALEIKASSSNIAQKFTQLSPSDKFLSASSLGTDLSISHQQDSQQKSFKEKLAVAVPTSSMIGGIETTEIIESVGPIVIDSDEIAEINTLDNKELATDPEKTKVIAGAKFPVIISSQINSRTARAGDPIEARLKYDLLIGQRLIAEAGSVVLGHIDYALQARTAMRALVSSQRWYKNSGCLGIIFDEVINSKGDHLPLLAKPSQQSEVIKNKGEGRLLGVNKSGQIVEPWSNQLKNKAVRLGLHAAMAPAGVFSFGAAPVALGVLGAANPSFAFQKPIGLNVRHRRIKGFAIGFLGGVPGGLVVQDSIIKGQEALIEPGDEFVAEFVQEFTGAPATEDSLLTRASSKVHGQVLPKKQKT